MFDDTAPRPLSNAPTARRRSVPMILPLLGFAAAVAVANVGDASATSPSAQPMTERGARDLPWEPVPVEEAPRELIEELVESDGSVPTELSCGTKLSDGFLWYGCSHDGVMCYGAVNLGEILDVSCTACEGPGQVDCTPWDDCSGEC